MHGVKLDEVCGRLCCCQVVEVNELKLVRPIKGNTEGQPADAAAPGGRYAGSSAAAGMISQCLLACSHLQQLLRC